MHMANAYVLRPGDAMLYRVLGVHHIIGAYIGTEAVFLRNIRGHHIQALDISLYMTHD